MVLIVTIPADDVGNASVEGCAFLSIGRKLDLQGDRIREGFVEHGAPFAQIVRHRVRGFSGHAHGHLLAHGTLAPDRHGWPALQDGVVREDRQHRDCGARRDHEHHARGAERPQARAPSYRRLGGSHQGHRPSP